MEAESTAERLVKLITKHPGLPVRVYVSSDLYNSENENYDVGEIAWCAVEEEYKGKDYVHFRLFDEYEDTLADACRKGDIPYKPENIYSEAFLDAEVERLYEALPWKECILLCVE